MELTRLFQNRLLCLLVFVGIVMVMCHIFDIDLIYFIGRKFLIGLLPFVDWTVLNRRSCVVMNPWYKPLPPSAKECLSCEDLTEVPQLTSVGSSRKLYEHFIDTSVPVVLRNGYTGTEVLLDDVLQAIQDNLLARVCAFRSNTPWTFDQFLEQTTSMNEFYALWENCNGEAKKLIRRFYNRPEQIPAVVELTGYSWVAASRRFVSRKPKVLDFAGGSIGVWIQVEGSCQVQLHRHRCRCNLELQMNKGDYLVVRIDGWNVSFVPNNSDGDALAIIPTGYLQ